MNAQQIQTQRSTIASLLKEQRLKEALIQLKALLYDSGLWQVSSRLEQVETSYNLMLKYFSEGVEDPYRDRLLRKLLEDSWEILDLSTMHLLKGPGADLFHEALSQIKPTDDVTALMSRHLGHLRGYERTMESMRASSHQQQKETAKSHDESLKSLFHLIWAQELLNEQNEALLEEALHDDAYYWGDLAMMVTAATLSLLEYFDPTRIRYLLSACRHSGSQVSARAQVGLLFALRIHKDRIKLLRDLQLQIEELLIEKDETLMMTTILVQVLQRQDTEMVVRKIQEEIMPEMMQSLRDFRDQNTENPDDLNPEWAAQGDSALGKNMQRMSDLQKEGADVYLPTFAKLKRFGFYQDLHHWLMPYSPLYHPVVEAFTLDPGDSDRALEHFIQYGLFCDNDKHNMIALLPHVPRQQIRGLFSQMTPEQMEELANLDNEALKELSKDRRTISAHFLQDLYRFFRIHPRGKEIPDPFTLDWSHESVAVLGPQISRDDALLKPISDYLFSKSHFDEALSIYKIMLDHGQDQESLIQKAGYALESLKRYQEAVKLYGRLITPQGGSVWTLRHMGHCYKNMGKFLKALDCYAMILDQDPADCGVIYERALCFVELEKWEEAMQEFFRLDYQEKDSVRALRGIVWCSLMLGKDEQAKNQLAKLIKSGPTAMDHLLEGHLWLIGGNIRNAVAAYKKSLEKQGSIEDFRQMFFKDEQLLVKRGVRKGTLQMVLDLMF